MLRESLKLFKGFFGRLRSSGHPPFLVPDMLRAANAGVPWRIPGFSCPKSLDLVLAGGVIILKLLDQLGLGKRFQVLHDAALRLFCRADRVLDAAHLPLRSFLSQGSRLPRLGVNNLCSRPSTSSSMAVSMVCSIRNEMYS